MDIYPYLFSIVLDRKPLNVRQRTATVGLIPITIVLEKINFISLSLFIAQKSVKQVSFIFHYSKIFSLYNRFIFFRKLFTTIVSNLSFLPLYIFKKIAYKTVRLSIAPLPALRGFIMISIPPPSRGILLIA
ncbi:MAG: hypothetical protein PHN64_03280 [Desulfovibrionaceae bacterium]|nr:hypothetical protein [Desulfovibrionaceae bacterium]